MLLTAFNLHMLSLLHIPIFSFRGISMKKLIALATLAVVFCASAAYADLINFNDISDAKVGGSPMSPISNASLNTGSSSFFADGQSITFWSSPGLALMNPKDGFPWRYNEKNKIGLYVAFDAGKKDKLYTAGLTFALPVFDLDITYEGGNKYKVIFEFADGTSSPASYLTTHGESGWGHEYEILEHNGIVGLTFLFEDNGNPDQLGLVSMSFTTLKKDPAPTPLPGTIWLMGMGATGLFAYARRKRMK
jgi:hypothetical protein